jgi:hypothetical protein
MRSFMQTAVAVASHLASSRKLFLTRAFVPELTPPFRAGVALVGRATLVPSVTRRAQGTLRTFSPSVGLAHSIVASGQPSLVSLRPGDQAGLSFQRCSYRPSLADKWVSNAAGLALARRSGPASWLLRRGVGGPTRNFAPRPVVLDSGCSGERSAANRCALSRRSAWISHTRPAFCPRT